MLIFSSKTENCRITYIPPSVKAYSASGGTEVRKGQKLTFICKNKKKFLHGNAEVECLANGQWSHPFPTCGGNSVLLQSMILFIHFFFKTIQTLCLQLFQPMLSFSFLDAIPCGKPPGLENGDLREGLLFEYQHSESVEYICKNLYVLDGRNYRTCNNGEWIGTVKCLSKCQ